VILNILILSLVTFERIAELWLARRNTRRLLSLGAREYAPRHYPAIVALHAAWLASLWLFALPHSIRPLWLAFFLVIELGRVWVLATLAERWTTRIIVLPEAPLVGGGPYRFTRHPNYIVVVAEILVLPLAFGLWRIALVFTLLNAVILAIRIHAEDRALGRSQPR